VWTGNAKESAALNKVEVEDLNNKSTVWVSFKDKK